MCRYTSALGAALGAQRTSESQWEGKGDKNGERREGLQGVGRFGTGVGRIRQRWQAGKRGWWVWEWRLNI